MARSDGTTGLQYAMLFANTCSDMCGISSSFEPNASPNWDVKSTPFDSSSEVLIYSSGDLAAVSVAT